MGVKMINKNLSIIIPCYNEERYIAKNIKKVINQMQKKWNIEIIAVNDGSTDDTKKEILKMATKHPDVVKLFSYKHNVGKGYAVYSGILKSKYKQKLIIDADLSVEPNNIDKFDFSKITESEYIIKGQRIQIERQPLYRIMLGKCWQLLVWMFIGINQDSQCPFTFLNVNDSFFSDMIIYGFAFDVEILFKAKYKGFKAYKMFVPYINDPHTKVMPKHTLQMFKDLLRIRKKYF